MSKGTGESPAAREGAGDAVRVVGMKRRVRLESARRRLYTRSSSSRDRQVYRRLQSQRRRLTAVMTVSAAVCAVVVLVTVQPPIAPTPRTSSPPAIEGTVVIPVVALTAEVASRIEDAPRAAGSGSAAEAVRNALTAEVVGSGATDFAAMSGAGRGQVTVPLGALGQAAAGHRLGVTVLSDGRPYEWVIRGVRVGPGGSGTVHAVAISPGAATTADIAVPSDARVDSIEFTLPVDHQAFYVLVVSG